MKNESSDTPLSNPANKIYIILHGGKEFVSGAAAFVEIEKQTLDCASSASDTDDVLVFLEPDDVPLLKIVCTETDIVLFGELDSARKGENVCIPHGQPFTVSIRCRTGKSKERLITEFEHPARPSNPAFK